MVNIQEPLIVIPDVQAHYRQLDGLVGYFRRSGYLADHKIVLLGDVVDRGCDSRLTVEMVCSLIDDGHVCLKGNHDFVLESAADLAPLDSSVRRAWISRWATRYEAGTLKSYGVRTPSRNAPLEEWVAAADALHEAMPERHRRFFREMPWFAETDNLVLVHAGLALGTTWEAQRLVLEKRERNDPRGPAQIFSHSLAGESYVLEGRIWTKRVVSGHAYVPSPVFTPARVLLNCGVELGGPLVAWVSDTDEVFTADSFNGKVEKLRREKR